MNHLDLFLVKLTLKEKTLPYSPETFWISDRSFVANELYSGSPDVYAGLADLGGFAQTMGEVMPATSSGQITLNNHRGSLGHDRRFSDLIQKFAFYWQEVQVYYFPKPVNSIGDSNDLVSEFKGRITNIKIDNASQLFQISVTSDEISNESPNFIIEESVYPNAPEGLFGEALPIVFGENVQVPALRISTNTEFFHISNYAYASSFSNIFINGGIKKYLAKDEDGSYVRVYGSNGLDPIPFDFCAFTDLSIAGTNTLNWDNFTEVCAGDVQSINPSSSTFAHDGSGIAFGGKAYLHDSNSSTRDGVLIVRLYKGTSGTIAPSVLVEEVRIPMTNFTLVSPAKNIGFPVSNQGRACEARFYFSKPRIINGGEYYWLSYSLDKPADGATQNMIPFVAQSSLTSIPLKKGDLSDPNSDWESLTYPSVPFPMSLAVQIDACRLVDSPNSFNNVKGISHSKFQIVRGNSPLSEIPDMTSVEFVVDIDGLKDSSSGTITGTNNQLITLPQDALKLLYYKQNNDSLTGWDYVISESNINSSFFPSIIKGASRGVNSYRDLMKDLLVAFSGKLYPSKNGGYRLWAYGSVVQVDYEIDDSDCTINEILYQGKGNIINSVTVKYDRRAIPLSLQDSQRKDSERDNYARTRIYEEGASFNSANVLSGSTLLYGREELQSEVRQIDWFSSDAIASRLARYILSTYGTESAILSISLPLIKNNFFNIRIGDILRINHPDMPSFFGSGTNTEQLPTLGGRVLDNFNLGYPWRRGEQMTVRVIARSPQIEITQQGEPQLNLIVREITKFEARRPEVN